VFPLVFELPPGDLEGAGADARGAADLGAVEAIPPADGFCVDLFEVGRDVAAGERGVLETLELGMVFVALSSAAEYRLSEQGLAPECDEALRV
jgi:hypothetical protein